MFNPFKRSGISFKYSDGTTNVNIRRDVTLSDAAVNRITAAIMSELHIFQELRQEMMGVPNFTVGSECVATSPVSLGGYQFTHHCAGDKEPENTSSKSGAASGKDKAVPAKTYHEHLLPKPDQYIKVKFPDSYTPQEVLNSLNELVRKYEEEMGTVHKSITTDLTNTKPAHIDSVSNPAETPTPTKAYNSVIQGQNANATMAEAMQKALDAQANRGPKNNARDLYSIPSNRLVFWACECGKSIICKAENLSDACSCGKPISKTAKMWHSLDAICPNCGQPTYGYAVAGLSEFKCKGCDSPVDVIFARGKLYGGSKM